MLFRSANFKHQLSSKFRTERKSLEALLGQTSGVDSQLIAGCKALKRRSEQLVPVVAELNNCARAGLLSLSLTDLAPSYLHMYVNRLLRSAHLAQELVLYDFLARLYESQSARCSAYAAAGTSVNSDRESEKAFGQNGQTERERIEPAALS